MRRVQKQSLPGVVGGPGRTACAEEAFTLSESDHSLDLPCLVLMTPCMSVRFRISS